MRETEVMMWCSLEVELQQHEQHVVGLAVVLSTILDVCRQPSYGNPDMADALWIYTIYDVVVDLIRCC